MIVAMITVHFNYAERRLDILRLLSMSDRCIGRRKQVNPKKMSSKVLFVGKKTRRPFGHCAPKLLSLATVNELKIIIFVFNYLTVLVYTKTIIHLIVGG